MYGTIRVTDYRNHADIKTLYLSVNAFWVTIKDEAGNTLFDRKPSNLNWLDPVHDKLTDLLSALEMATIEAANSKT